MKNDISALTDQLTRILNDFAENTGDQARKSYKKARRSVEPVISDLSDRAVERGQAFAETAHDAALSFEESIEDAIHDRPLLAMGVAIGIGFLIGSSWKR